MRQAQDLAEIPAQLLRRGHLLPVARRQVEEPVGAKCDTVREMPVAADLGLLAPDRPEILECRGAGFSQIEGPIAQHRAARAIFPCLDIAKVNAGVRCEVGMGHDIAEAALPCDLDLGNSRHGRALATRDINEPQPPVLLREQRHVGEPDAAARQESHRPGRIEIGNLGHAERPIGARLIIFGLRRPL